MTHASPTDHPAIGRPNYVYPHHYTPADRDYQARVTFVSREGETFAGQDFRAPAGTCGTWTIRLTNREADLGAGALIAFVGFNCQFAHAFQATRPQARDFVTVEAESDAALEVFPGRGRMLGYVRVNAGTFRTGDTLTVRWGDRRQGSVGSEVFWTATQAQILVAVDADGSGNLLGVRGNPFRFEVAAHHELKLLRILGPTAAAVGEPFALHLAAFDRNRNVIDTFEGSVELSARPGLVGLPRQVALRPEDRGIRILDGLRADAPGVYRVQARSDAAQGECFASNPIVASPEPETRVFWGDVHCHGWGDDSMYLMYLRTPKVDPLDRHRQAVRVGRFDFGAPGPMALPFDAREEIWDAYRAAGRQVDEPGRYVPFLSYEAHPSEGDRNVVFKRLDEPAPDLQYRTAMPELDARYRERDDVFLEVHIGGHPPEWEKYEPARERMVEVVSGFGNAEWLLQRALQRGYRPALVGASDLHVGLMGGPRAVETFRGRFGYSMTMNQRDAGYGTGPVTAVCAPELTRDALWEAMAQGRTYASTGARIYLSLECNGLGAGSAVAVRDTLRMALTCHACAQIERVDLIAGDRCLRSWRPNALDFEVTEEMDAARVPGEWVYARVRQVDAEYAWSGLVWLEHPGPAPAGTGLPLWNEHEPLDLKSIPANAADAHLPDLKRYLALEEDTALFHDLTPAGVVREAPGAAALFLCWYGPERRPMSIRWFFEFEIPKIRYDFGWRDFGPQDEFDVGAWGK